MLTKRLSIAVTAFLMSLGMQGAWAQSFGAPGGDAFEQGIVYFNARRYQDAAHCLRRAAQERQQDPIAHYYLANVLSRLCDHNEAIAEYRKSYLLDPYGIVSGYCRKALSAYRAPLPEVNKSEIITSKAHDRNTISVNTPTFINSVDTPALSLPKQRRHVIGAIWAIKKQADSEKERHKQLAENIAASAIEIGEDQARRVEEEARLEMHRILNPPPVLIGSGQYNPLLYSPQYATARAEEVKRNAEDYAKMIRALAAEKSLRYKKWSELKQIELDQTAKNLESQLTSSTLPGSSRLSPIGTGLFVRYYGVGSERSTYPEVHQSVVRILPSSPTFSQTRH